MTTNRNDPALREVHTEGYLKGQQKDYLVLSEEERAKGFVRPVRCKYIHLKCGVVTRMGQALAETYARDPKFYGGTFCVGCGAHFDLILITDRPCYECNQQGGKYLNGSFIECNHCFGKRVVLIRSPAFVWDGDGEPVGSNAEEAAEWNAKKQQREVDKQAGSGI